MTYMTYVTYVTYVTWTSGLQMINKVKERVNFLIRINNMRKLKPEPEALINTYRLLLRREV